MAMEARAQPLLLSPLVSMQRLHMVATAAFGHPHAPDALLLIGGVDCRDDEMNASVLNFLMTPLTAPTSSILHPALEDVMVVIHRAGTHVYLPHDSALLFASVSQFWPHLTVSVMPRPAIDDADFSSRFEEHKMDAFRKMLAHHKKIGVVYATSHGGRTRRRSSSAGLSCSLTPTTRRAAVLSLPWTRRSRT
jgi:hypothetical protein